MNEDKEKLDQAALAESVANKIDYDFVDAILVKPLDPIKVKKEFNVPVTDEHQEAKTDKNGIEAIDFDEVATEVKEVDSDWREGVIIKLPMTYESGKLNETSLQSTMKLHVGDTVLFSDKCGRWFDLVKDSLLIRIYDVVAVKK